MFWPSCLRLFKRLIEYSIRFNFLAFNSFNQKFSDQLSQCFTLRFSLPPFRKPTSKCPFRFRKLPCKQGSKTSPPKVFTPPLYWNPSYLEIFFILVFFSSICTPPLPLPPPPSPPASFTDIGNLHPSPFKFILFNFLQNSTPCAF